MLRVSVAVPSEAKDMMPQSGLSAVQEAKTNKTHPNWLMKLEALPNHLLLREARPKTDNTSQLVLSKGDTLYPKHSLTDTTKGEHLSGKMVQNQIFTDTLIICSAV